MFRALSLALFSAAISFSAAAQQSLFQPMKMNLEEAMTLLDSSRYRLQDLGKKKGLVLTVFQTEAAVDSSVISYRNRRSRPRMMTNWYNRHPGGITSQIQAGEYRYSVRLRRHGYLRNTNFGETFTWYDRDFDRWYITYVFEGW